MISKTPEQRLLYNARLKFQRDEVKRILQARLVGHQVGRQEGEEIGDARGEARGEACGLQIGRITVLQEFPGLRLSTAEDFSGCDAAQLITIAEQLQQQLRSRNS